MLSDKNKDNVSGGVELKRRSTDCCTESWRASPICHTPHAELQISPVDSAALPGGLDQSRPRVTARHRGERLVPWGDKNNNNPVLQRDPAKVDATRDGWPNEKPRTSAELREPLINLWPSVHLPAVNIWRDAFRTTPVDSSEPRQCSARPRRIPLFTFRNSSL